MNINTILATKAEPILKVGVGTISIIFFGDLKSSYKKKSNPIAKDLRTPKYKQRSVKSKKIYNRKKKNI